jgi:3-phosphoshikimate 1-carboxyvinyltransferase
LSSRLQIARASSIQGEAVQLPSSKSISNRVLILNALSGNQSIVRNLSAARDTKLMMALVNNPEKLIDVMDAGTTMRFLTAYFAVSGKNKILTGTDRMKQRPIGLLVNALRELGANVSYLENDGFPPIETKGFTAQKSVKVSIPGDISSQYISALMMVAPSLPEGLTVQLTGKIGSRPYIEMTAALMETFGVSPEFNGQIIRIPPGAYRPTPITVEADWSAASYWFAFTALAEKAKIILPNVAQKSLQGDRVIVGIMEKLGVKSVFKNTTATLTKQPSAGFIEWDFTDCPDLAQTVFPVCAAKGIDGLFTGLESLRIKETDRIAALQTELGKIGASLTEEKTGQWKLASQKQTPRNPITIQTYHDHRMAMGLAPLATLMDLTIEEPDVINKSYPGFWEDMRAVGFKIT